MNNYLRCPTCETEYTHIIGTLEVVTDPNKHPIEKEKVVEIIVNGKFHIPVDTRLGYEYETQGNIHLLFSCEVSGHFFIKSFDGHKGNMHLDNNSLMDGLALYLTNVYEKEELHGKVDYRMLGHIESFLNR